MPTSARGTLIPSRQLWRFWHGNPGDARFTTRRRKKFGKDNPGNTRTAENAEDAEKRDKCCRGNGVFSLRSPRSPR